MIITETSQPATLFPIQPMESASSRLDQPSPFMQMLNQAPQDFSSSSQITQASTDPPQVSPPDASPQPEKSAAGAESSQAKDDAAAQSKGTETQKATARSKAKKTSDQDGASFVEEEQGPEPLLAPSKEEVMLAVQGEQAAQKKTTEPGSLEPGESKEKNKVVGAAQEKNKLLIIELPLTEDSSPRESKLVGKERLAKKASQGLKASGEGAEKLSVTQKPSPPPESDMQRDFQQEGRRETEIHVFLPTRGQTSGQTEMPSTTELSRMFRENIMGQIVRYAGMQVRDQGTGELRLKLHPQSLGEVRISLQLSNDEVTGKVWVDNSAVRDMFEQNFSQLEQSFSQKGLQLSGFSVFVNDEHSESFEEFSRSASEAHTGSDNYESEAGYYDIAFDSSYINVLV